MNRTDMLRAVAAGRVRPIADRALVGGRSLRHTNSSSSLQALIRTFSLCPVPGDSVGLDLSSTETSTVSPPDRFRATLHRNGLSLAIGSQKQFGIAFQHLSHHRMLLPQVSLN